MVLSLVTLSAMSRRRMREASSEVTIPSMSGKAARASLTAGSGPNPVKSMDLERAVIRLAEHFQSREEALWPMKRMVEAMSPLLSMHESAIFLASDVAAVLSPFSIATSTNDLSIVWRSSLCETASERR